MKKFIVGFTLAIMLTIFTTPFTTNANNMRWIIKLGGKEIYASTMIVTKVDVKRNKVYCKNATGFKYRFSGIADFEKGDIISCIMYTKKTPYIKDDVVLSAKYERVDLLKLK